ncbi:MAG TPA: aldo/keto reductase [Opitutaceae bacterium]|nr:aldo/keto reductase [Opitutaceae bacterium]
METRKLGGSDFKVPVLSLGTATFGGGRGFTEWGNTDAKAATRLVDLCLEAGLNLFDSADVYSDGAAETILGAAIKGRRNRVLISTKSTFRSGPGPDDVGSSRKHLVAACESSLRRLGVETIDLYQLHGFDAMTPIEEALGALDELVRAGKIRYIGCSNFSGWHLMKSLAISEKHGFARYIAHQAYYSLIGREYEWELMPLALDQKVGAVVWSPLGMGRLGGKVRRDQSLPKVSRLNDPGTVRIAPPAEDEYVFRVVDALDAVAQETGRSVAQVAINWVLQRPSVATVIIGARDEAQLRQNLAAADWKLTPAQVAVLDAASAKERIYPYWHQAQFKERNPFPTS